MIRAFLFDLDGVLTLEKTGSQSVLSFLSQQTGLPFERFRQAYLPYNRDLLFGRTTHRDIWPELCAALETDLDESLLEAAFRATPMDTEIIRLARELKKDFLIGMITDNKCDRMEDILDCFHLRDLFDAVLISARIGSRKDQPDIFSEALAALKIQPEEAVFIDNSPGNLIIPAQMGIHTILFDDEKRDMDALWTAIQQLI